MTEIPQKTATVRSSPSPAPSTAGARVHHLVMHKLDGEIEFDPHAVGACVLRLDEQAATQLRDQLTEWLQ